MLTSARRRTRTDVVEEVPAAHNKKAPVRKGDKSNPDASDLPSVKKESMKESEEDDSEEDEKKSKKPKKGVNPFAKKKDDDDEEEGDGVA